MGRFRRTAEPRVDWRAGGIAGVGSVHGGCGARGPGGFSGAVGDNDGDDRSGIRRSRDFGVPQAGPAAVSGWHSAYADMSAPWLYIRERAGACTDPGDAERYAFAGRLRDAAAGSGSKSGFI